MTAAIKSVTAEAQDVGSAGGRWLQMTKSTQTTMQTTNETDATSRSLRVLFTAVGLVNSKFGTSVSPIPWCETKLWTTT